MDYEEEIPVGDIQLIRLLTPIQFINALPMAIIA